MKLGTIVLVCVLIAGSATAAEGEAPGSPFVLPLPDGWRSETIPFPLEFAPDLDYEGIEELRFAPGMFKEGADDFWSYAFVWWIDADTKIEPYVLSRDLELYFEGLATAVVEGRGTEIGDAEFRVELTEPKAGDDRVFNLVGTAETFDPFVTKAQLTLNMRVTEISCPTEDRLAVFFELSPQSYDHRVWTELTGIREGFRCSR